MPPGKERLRDRHGCYRLWSVMSWPLLLGTHNFTPTQGMWLKPPSPSHTLLRLSGPLTGCGASALSGSDLITLLKYCAARRSSPRLLCGIPMAKRIWVSSGLPCVVRPGSPELPESRRYATPSIVSNSLSGSSCQPRSLLS